MMKMGITLVIEGEEKELNELKAKIVSIASNNIVAIATHNDEVPKKEIEVASFVLKGF